jgi:hypothetical protein
MVWDLTNGQLQHDVALESMRWKTDLNWAGDFLLAGNQFLYDVERRILLWEYQGASGHDPSSTMQDGRLWVVTKPQEGRSAVLVSTAMPHAAALEEAKRLPSAAELLCVKPGDAVAIEVDIDPSVVFTDDVEKALNAKIRGVEQAEDERAGVVLLNPGQAQNDLVHRALAASLTAAGLKVVEKSDLVVSAVCKPQPPQTIRINTDRRFPVRPEDIVERTITPHASHLEMTLHGESLWKRGYIATAGMMIFKQEGESLDQALDRLTKPNLSVFTNAKFSAYVARPGKATRNGAYGVSQFTSGGLIDGKSSDGRGGVAFE